MATETVRLGESKAQVIQQLGKPRGQMVTGESETLFYERGSVDFANGVVSLIRLRGVEEMREEEERMRHEAVARQASRKGQLNERIREAVHDGSEGTESSALQKLSPDQRLSYWLELQEARPDVPVTNEIATARREVLAAEKGALEARIAELEQEIQNVTRKLHATGISRLKRRYRREREILSEEMEALRQDHRALE
ncbi:MAG: hypothetical protein O2901_01650 [Verrucomicrobia bacterium]|nr:hypothetical protein [Verrucomicrobiota bacterium]